jgi:hypothetical protein
MGIPGPGGDFVAPGHKKYWKTQTIKLVDSEGVIRKSITKPKRSSMLILRE